MRRARLVLAVLLVVIPAALASPAQAKDDLRAQRERVRQKRAVAAARVDVLRSNETQVRRALDAVEASVRAEEARLADARRDANEAAAELAAVREAEAAARTRLDRAQRAAVAYAVGAYVEPNQSDASALLESRSLGELARKGVLLDVAGKRGRQVVEGLRVAREDVEAKRRGAEKAAKRAEQRRAAVRGRVTGLRKARDRQARFVDSVERRLDRTLAEADALASLDKRISGEVARRDAALVARLRTIRSRARTASGSSVGTSVRVGGGLASVRGIVVSASIARSLAAMLAAAQADGITLGGQGYRNPAAQIALRRAHCGSSRYAIYEMPASQCSPPTAPPGSSMHERGLAVDFTANGALISSRRNPAYRWLAGNAAGYGFYNLPSEPWHWSTNGQ